MAITVNHILSDLRNEASSGSNPQGFRIKDAQILYWIDQCRATLISQALQKRQDISDIWIQPITCLDLIEVDKSECCEVTTSCLVLRTELQLPNTIETNGDNLIIRVVKNNGDIISKTNQQASKYDSYSKYSKNKTKWYLKNNYIYIFNSNEEEVIEQINVWGIWDRPQDLATFSACGGGNCYSLNSSYPCSMKMASTIMDIVLKTKVFPFIQLPQDTTNDANDKFDNQPNTRGL